MDPQGADPAVAPAEFYRADLLASLALLTLTFLAVALVLPGTVVEVPLGLITLLLAPGYALGSIAFRGRPDFPWPGSLAIVVGVSVAFNVVLGLALLEAGAGLPAPFFAEAAFALCLVAQAVKLGRGEGSGAGVGRYLLRQVGLPGHTRRQRGAAYGLLAAIAVVLVAILYLASVHPNVHPAISLALEGAGGGLTTLPRHAAVGQVLEVWVTVTNNDTTQTLLLIVQSVNESSIPQGFRVVPWALPLQLANATQSSDSFNLGPEQSYTLDVTFTYGYPGTYAISFYLSSLSGATLRTTGLSLQIS